MISTATSSHAGSVMIPGMYGGGITVSATSLKEQNFLTTIRQKYDYSCGSAALATLLTHHYEDRVLENEVFQWMYENGNQEKIRREGFSLLDMKNYLTHRGYNSDGYFVDLDKLAKVSVPAVVLINNRGYRHFVVVKGVTDNRVLIGDPNAGIRVMPRGDFEKSWNGLVFIITTQRTQTEKNFNRLSEWRVREPAPLGTALRPNELANLSILLPGPGGAGP